MWWLLAGVTFIGGAFVAVYFALDGVPVGRVTSDRLDRYRAGETKPLLTKIADDLVAFVERLMSRRGWRPFSAEELELAGVKTPVASIVVLVVCISIAVFAVGFVILQSLFLAILLAVLAPVGTKLWVKFRADRRCKKFADQLPMALQSMAASLRAGHSLPRAIDAVSRDADAPIAEELARVVNENRLGRDLVAALDQVAVRMKSKDFSWVAGAIGAQRETGGNLNEILDQVAETIRERNHIRQQVYALSAEGRVSAYILMGLPVGMGLYYGTVNGELMGAFIDSGIGKILLAASLVMYVLGGFWMRSIVRIEF